MSFASLLNPWLFDLMQRLGVAANLATPSFAGMFISYTFTNFLFNKLAG